MRRQGERDAAIRQLSARWSKHALEVLLIAGAAVYAAWVGNAASPGGAPALIAVLFGCVYVANPVIVLEAGRYAPSLELAFRLARAFRIGVEDVFCWETP